MKKIVMCAICVGFTVQAEASIGAYLRAAASGTLTNSDFDMNYDVNPNNQNGFPNANTVVNNKAHSICNVGARVAVGIKAKLENDWFFGGELNYFLNRAKHNHDFTEAEDGENNPNSGIAGRISYINIKHKDEIGFALRFGKEFVGHDFYGICGVTTKKMETKYGLDHNHSNIHGTEDLTTNFKKRLWGLVFGVGASRKISENVSCSLEYRYKIFNSSTKDVDWTTEKKAFDDANPLHDHDMSPRHFKVKADNHELSFGFTLNI